MAEYVEIRAEERIKELEQMEKILMFDAREIREIVKRRKEAEYRLMRRNKNKDDFLNYIRQELDLLQLVRLRKESLGLACGQNNVEFLVARRVDNLFKSVLQLFGSDMRVWISFMRFCKRVHFFTSVSRMLPKLLQLHGDKPQTWRLAAHWEFNECKSVEMARSHLLRGLRLHPECKFLYLEAFKLEIAYMNRMRKEVAQKMEKEKQASSSSGVGASSNSEAQNVGDNSKVTTPHILDESVREVLSGRLAEVVYFSAVRKVTDVSFIIDLLNVVKKYDFTSKLQKKIINDMLTRHPKDELTWDAMARRELEGFVYSSDGTSKPEDEFSFQLSDGSDDEMSVGEDSVGNKKSSDSKDSAGKLSLKDRIRRCVAVYEAGVLQLPTERMWSRYIDAMQELTQETSSLHNFKRKMLRKAYQGAHSAGKMQAKYYLMWVDILQSAGKLKKLCGVLRVATERLPDSAELWHLRLRLHLARNEEQQAMNVFNDAISHLGTKEINILPLWKTLIQYYQTLSIIRVEEVFQSGLSQIGSPVSTALKPLYLEWLVSVKGIFAARNVYDKLSVQPPLCLELHIKMASLENSVPETNPKFLRRCHELACEQFGRDNTDVWMEYVKFEQKTGEAKNVSEIYWRALKNLDPRHTDTFISEFSLAKTGLAGSSATNSIFS